MADEKLIRTADERVQEIVDDAAARIAQLMKTSGGGITVGWLFMAKIWELSEEERAAIEAGGDEPNPSLKLVNNVSDDCLLDFLAEVGEYIAENGVEEGNTTKLQ